MCKIAVFPHIKQGHESKALKLAQAMTPGMTAQDKDGFGYMTLGENGIFGERWLDVKKAWKGKPKIDKALYNALTIYGDSLVSPETYNAFGIPSKRIFCIALHGRLSTNSVSIENTHPFVRDCEKNAIIHNGIISNTHEFKADMKTTCDSETILIQVKKSKLAESPKAIQDVSDQLNGYFAVASLAKTESGQWVLDVFKDSKASLYAVFVAELQSFVFCTDAKIVRDACRKIGFHALQSFQVSDNTLIRHNPMTGEVLARESFTESLPSPVTINYGAFNDSGDKSAYLYETPGYRVDDDTPSDYEEIMDTVDYFKRRK